MTRTIPLTALLLVVGCATSDDTASDDTDTDTDTELAFVPPDEPGPFRAGVETLEFTDTRGKSLKVEVWYPADPLPGDTPDRYDEIPVALDGYRLAPADARGAPYPVVGFTHGLGGIRFQSAFLMEHLASHGFVVVAPDHDGHILLDMRVDETQRIVTERPGDVIEAIEHVVGLSNDGHERLGGMVDASELGIAGHSFGGITTMMLAGGDVDFDGLISWCDENSSNGCNYIGRFDPDDARAFDPGDDRVVAALAMSPGAWYAFGEDGTGLEGLPPTLIMGGTADGTLDYEVEIRPTFEALTGTRYMATLADAGHYAAYSDMCVFLSFYGDCTGPEEGFLEAERGRATTVPLATAFLKVHLARDEAYRPWLDTELPDEPALTWEALTE